MGALLRVPVRGRCPAPARVIHKTRASANGTAAVFRQATAVATAGGGTVVADFASSRGVAGSQGTAVADSHAAAGAGRIVTVPAGASTAAALACWALALGVPAITGSAVAGVRTCRGRTRRVLAGAVLGGRTLRLSGGSRSCSALGERGSRGSLLAGCS